MAAIWRVERPFRVGPSDLSKRGSNAWHSQFKLQGGSCTLLFYNRRYRNSSRLRLRTTSRSADAVSCNYEPGRDNVARSNDEGPHTLMRHKAR
jgi:hypothetical protein